MTVNLRAILGATDVSIFQGMSLERLVIYGRVLVGCTLPNASRARQLVRMEYTNRMAALLN